MFDVAASSHRRRPGLALLLPIGFVLAGVASATTDAAACTSFLVTKGASADSSSMVTYAADSHDLYGELYYRPAASYPDGARMDVHEWDTGKSLGTIAQAKKTYRVVGNMNEHQVVVAESTFGGRETLENPEGGIDYGSLIYVSLQRSKTAREVISNVVDLAEEYGYASEGESFSIADPNEVWIMDLIGKGKGAKGIVWVARRVPDGYVTAHANQSRIRTFPRNEPETCKYAKDVVSFAREKGFFTGKDEDFSFADVYSPPNCESNRGSEARVWSFFHRIAPSVTIPSDLLLCKEGAPPLPLWVKPDAKLTPKDLMRAMRDHFEGTPLDMTKDVGAGPFELPYRWRPLTWELDGKTYMNERATATQQTGFSFVAQSRSFLPDSIGGLLWFGVDDTASSVYVPMYAAMKRIPKAYAVGTGTFQEFSWDSAFWVFNWVANQTYARYKDMIVDVRKVQEDFESAFLADQPKVEEKAAELYRTSPKAAEEYLNTYSENAATKVVARWRKLGEQLFVKYLDGNVRDDKGVAKHPPPPESWYRRIAAETGDHFVVKQGAPAVKSDGVLSETAAPAASGKALEPKPASPDVAPKAAAGRCSQSPGPTGSNGYGVVGVMLGLLGLRRRSRR